MEEQKIFFSYSRVDGESFAFKLADDLRKAGANIWLDQQNIKPGKIWDLEIEKALESSNCVLFLASEKSTTSNNVLNEVYYAIEEKKEVIPVIIHDCKIPFRLKRLQYIDFTHDYNVGLTRLLKSLEAYLSTRPDGLNVSSKNYSDAIETRTNEVSLTDEDKQKENHSIVNEDEIHESSGTENKPVINQPIQRNKLSDIIETAEKTIQHFLPIMRGNSGEAEFPVKQDIVFNVVCTAITTIKGMKIESSDKALARIIVKTGMNVWSWGENIYIQLSPVSESRTKVQITSHKIGNKYADVLDSGKNKKNVERILISTSKILSDLLPI